MRTESKLEVVRSLPKLDVTETLKWLMEREEVTNWMLEWLRMRGLIELSDGKWSGAGVKTRGKNGRPSLITSSNYIDRVIAVMGEREWGTREISRACGDFMSPESVRRLLLNQLKHGRVTHEKKWQVKKHVDGNGAANP